MANFRGMIQWEEFSNYLDRMESASNLNQVISHTFCSCLNGILAF